jgi:hypothetical protein
VSEKSRRRRGGEEVLTIEKRRREFRSRKDGDAVRGRLLKEI